MQFFAAAIAEVSRNHINAINNHLTSMDQPRAIQDLRALIARLPPEIPIASADHPLATLYAFKPSSLQGYDDEEEDGPWRTFNTKTDSVFQGMSSSSGVEFNFECVVRGNNGFGGMCDWLGEWWSVIAEGLMETKVDRIDRGIKQYL